MQAPEIAFCCSTNLASTNASYVLFLVRLWLSVVNRSLSVFLVEL